MQALPSIDWTHWAAWQVPTARFEQRRESRLSYVRYKELFNYTFGDLFMITVILPRHRDKPKPGDLMITTRQRLWETLNWLSLQYSAGAPVEAFAEVWPHALVWAEECAGFQEAYRHTPDAIGWVMPRVDLKSSEYWLTALRLVCFGLLSGHAAQMPRVMAILDFTNAELGIRDGLLERLVAPFVPGRGTPPDTATRHLPYRELFKVFDATSEKRPALMAKYLDDWYLASRREPYTDQHDVEGLPFYGYWSWEAAAVTWLLDIDDSSYRDMPFYPRDLVDFARRLPQTPATPSAPPPVCPG